MTERGKETISIVKGAITGSVETLFGHEKLPLSNTDARNSNVVHTQL